MFWEESTRKKKSKSKGKASSKGKDGKDKKKKKKKGKKNKKVLTEAQKKKNEEKEKERLKKKAEAEKERAAEKERKKAYQDKVADARKAKCLHSPTFTPKKNLSSHWLLLQVMNQLTAKIGDTRSKMEKSKRLILGSWISKTWQTVKAEVWGLHIDIYMLMRNPFEIGGMSIDHLWHHIFCIYLRSPALAKAMCAQLGEQRNEMQHARDELQTVVDNFEDSWSLSPIAFLHTDTC